MLRHNEQQIRIKVATYLRLHDVIARELCRMHKIPMRVDGNESESNKYVQLKLKNEVEF